MQRIALWNTAFLGDTVLTLPLIRVLRAAFPHAELDFYVRQGLEGLYAAQPELTRVIPFDKRGADGGSAALLRLGHDLAACAYDLFICAHQSPRSALLTRLCKAPVRVGYAADSFSGRLAALCLPYTHTVPRRFTELHEIDRLLQLARPICPPEVVDNPALHWPELVLPAHEIATAEAFWQRHVRGPVLGLHPGSVWATKRWTPEGFARMLRRTVEAGAQAMLFAGPGEEEAVRRILLLARVEAVTVQARHLAGHPLPQGAVYDFSASLSLPQLAAFLGRLDAYLSNDSGPLHLAWSQRTPVCALFGPTTRALGFFPQGPQARVHEVDIACRPCGLHGPTACPQGHHRCMTTIADEDVWNTLRGMLFGAR